jgi:phosphodiesterase/alkaline phosphatase D-like protein
MTVSRREFCATTAAASVAALVRFDAHSQDTGRRVFRHGVASGDPLADRAIIWTRITAPPSATPEVSWEVAADAAFRRIVARGTTVTGASRDHTVKMDVVGLQPATSYYYRFLAIGERSPVGRTRTLPAAGRGAPPPRDRLLFQPAVRLLQRLPAHRRAHRSRRRSSSRRLFLRIPEQAVWRRHRVRPCSTTGS